MLKSGLLLVLLCSSACKKETKPADKAATPPAAEGAKPGEAKPGEAPAPAVAQPAAGDQSDAAKVLEAVFAAAATGKADGLAALCDPAGSGDGDVKSICEVKPDHPKWGEFVSYFAKGKIKSPPQIEFDKASIEFTFGPDGTKNEKMNLNKINGKWYLAGF